MLRSLAACVLASNTRAWEMGARVISGVIQSKTAQTVQYLRGHHHEQLGAIYRVSMAEPARPTGRA